MAQFTAHSEFRLAVVCQELGVQANTVAALRQHLEQAEPETDSAICFAVNNQAFLSDREQWAPSNVLAAVIRGGRIVTVLGTRKGQANPGHLRVNAIEWLR